MTTQDYKNEFNRMTAEGVEPEQAYGEMIAK